MSTEVVTFVLILAAIPAVNGFPLLLALTTRWAETLIGRALMTSTVGLALLIDVALVFRILGQEHPTRRYVLLVVFAVIVVGAWMQFVALLTEKWRHRRARVHRLP